MGEKLTRGTRRQLPWGDHDRPPELSGCGVPERGGSHFTPRKAEVPGTGVPTGPVGDLACSQDRRSDGDKGVENEQDHTRNGEGIPAEAAECLRLIPAPALPVRFDGDSCYIISRDVHQSYLILGSATA